MHRPARRDLVQVVDMGMHSRARILFTTLLWKTAVKKTGLANNSEVVWAFGWQY
jgi:hypothetical protein